MLFTPNALAPGRGQLIEAFGVRKQEGNAAFRPHCKNAG